MSWAIHTPSIGNLRWLESAGVQRSVRHIEDHIHAILVLECSFKDLAHALCVCLVPGLAYS